MDLARDNTRIGRQLSMAATAIGLWGALVLLFATPLALTGPISWRQAVRFGGSFWALWLVFLPAVAWLSFRLPIERRRLLRNVGLHGLACLLVVGANRTSFRNFRWLSPAPQRLEAPDRPPLAMGYRQGAPGAFDAFLGLRAALDVLVYWSVVGVCAAVSGSRRSQERERRAADLEARLSSARLQALRMQINPHFLFNTLNSIAALVYVDPRAADEMLGDLSQLLRRSLDSMEAQEIPLAQELEFIGGYINIEKKRFGERLRVEQRVPDELMNAMVPAFLLQPLVENAIRHGIEPRREPGLISIEAEQEAGQLHLVVRDTGRGLPVTDPTRIGQGGIGLINTRARLQALYGRDHTFSMGRAEPQGCRVDIQLPLRLGELPVPDASTGPA